MHFIKNMLKSNNSNTLCISPICKILSSYRILLWFKW